MEEEEKKGKSNEMVMKWEMKRMGKNRGGKRRVRIGREGSDRNESKKSHADQ